MALLVSGSVGGLSRAGLMSAWGSLLMASLMWESLEGGIEVLCPSLRDLGFFRPLRVDWALKLMIYLGFFSDQRFPVSAE